MIVEAIVQRKPKGNPVLDLAREEMKRRLVDEKRGFRKSVHGMAVVDFSPRRNPPTLTRAHYRRLVHT